MTTMNETTNRYFLIDAGGAPIKAWTRGVPFEDEARAQVERTSRVSVVRAIAVMPDVHAGKGATIGSVIATKDAIIPAAVGVDLGCGMMAVRTSLRASDLPSDLRPLRDAIEQRVPHGRTNDGGEGDRGAWAELPSRVANAWAALEPGFRELTDRCPKIALSNAANHLGTLGTGNHFIEVCLDEADRVWVMLHSGSRGVGNRIGSVYIARAKEEMLRLDRTMPTDRDLAYVEEGTSSFDDYVRAVSWAQRFALVNREVMMAASLEALRAALCDGAGVPPFTTDDVAVNCHHNYVAKEEHGGEHVWITRKGAVRAGDGELGIIPGSMGARSFIVRGRGNPASFCSCSHGAGRSMSRTAAKKRFSLDDHARATAGIECRKDEGVLDETPMAYKSIEAVMAAQADLVSVVHELRQIVCVKG
jgi:tRNA-splicing ligase RtcB